MTKVLMSSGSPNSWVGDAFSPLLTDQISVMLKKEESYCCADYLHSIGPSTAEKNDVIDEQWRQKSAEWMFKVIDFYDLDRDIVNVGMTILDRIFTVSSFHLKWNKLQCRLISMSSLKLAIKLNEPRTMNMEDMIKLAYGGEIAFSAKILIEMEQEILWKLSWAIFPPTVFCFAHHLICMFPSDVLPQTRYIIQELSKYMSELAICVYSFVKYKASSKAFACVSVAMESLDGDAILSSGSKIIFLKRVASTFNLRPNDSEIKVLRRELRELMHHNTNLKEFVALIRASNNEYEQESPKTAIVKQLEGSLCY